MLPLYHARFHVLFQRSILSKIWRQNASFFGQFIGGVTQNFVSGSMKVFWFFLFSEICPIAAKPRHLWTEHWCVELRVSHRNTLVGSKASNSNNKKAFSFVSSLLFSPPLFAQKLSDDRRKTTQREHRHARQTKERDIFSQTRSTQ